MRLDQILDQIEAGEYDPTVSGSTVEFYCLEEEYGVSPEPRDPAEAAETDTKNPTYGKVLTAEETAFIDRPTVRRAMGAGWLVTNPVPTAIRTPQGTSSSVPITQTDFDHISDYADSRGIDARFGVAPGRTLWGVNTGWVVDVPDGYSMLYAHPFNYEAKEFRTIPGIIDADQFPYMLRVPVVVNIDRGNIQFDEPIAQIVPFKRSEDSIEAIVDVIEGEPASHGECANADS